MAELVQRVPGAIKNGQVGGAPALSLGILSGALDAYDTWVAERTAYENEFHPPEDDTAFAAWERAGPELPLLGTAVAVLSRTERSRLRMLALFHSGCRVRLCAHDFQGLDEEGERYVDDWTKAVRAL